MDIENYAALKHEGMLEFFGNDNPRCPHCGDTHEIWEQDWSELYDDNDYHDVSCPTCEKEFRVSTNIRYSFSTDQIIEED